MGFTIFCFFSPHIWVLDDTRLAPKAKQRHKTQTKTQDKYKDTRQRQNTKYKIQKTKDNISITTTVILHVYGQFCLLSFVFCILYSVFVLCLCLCLVSLFCLWCQSCVIRYPDMWRKKQKIVNWYRGIIYYCQLSVISS